MNTFCEICGGETTIQTTDSYHYTESGLKNIILKNIEIRICNQCGAKSPLIPQILKLHEEIAKSLALQPQPLSGEEVRFLRKMLGVKAKDWASHLRIDPSTLSRWESGDQAIGPQADALIRFLFLDLLKERRSPNAEPSVAHLLAGMKQVREASLSVTMDAANPSHFQYVA